MKRIGIIVALLLVLATITIIASAGQSTATVAVSANILNTVLGTITVTPGTVTVPLEGTQLFTATGVNTASEPLDINPTWTTTGGTLDVTGGVTTTLTVGQYEAPGVITLTATQGSVSGTATVTVLQVVSISVEQTDINFGNVGVGATSDPQEKTIYNAGNVPVTVTMSATPMHQFGQPDIPSNSIAVLPAQQPWILAVGGNVITSLTLTVPLDAHSGIYDGEITYTATG